jgi:hypothetical protein
MAKVLLHSVSLEDSRIAKWMQGAYDLFTASAGLDHFGVHSLTSDPCDADLIVFAELGSHGIFAERVRHHPYVKKFREKCFLFDPSDYALPLLPGVYASLRKKYYHAARTCTGYYLRVDENPYVEFRPPQQNYQYIASFIGSIENDPVRAKFLKLPRESFVVEDTSSYAVRMLYGGEKEERHRFWSHYADVIASAPFALCPRGRGPGSVRLFEAMQMGRVPVIISDEWVYPTRVDWQACSISVPEKAVETIPEILRDFRSRATEMGQRARQEWEKYYSPSVRFHWLVEDCLAMRQRRRMPEAIAGRLVWLHLFNYSTFRLYLISKRGIYRETGKIVL